jgi:hypothetical protein
MIDLPGPANMKYYGHDSDAFIEYTGEGVLVLEDYTELDCEFKAGQFTNGKIILICSLLPISIHRINTDQWERGTIHANYLKGRTSKDEFFEAIEVGFSHIQFLNDNPIVIGAVFTPNEIIIGAVDGEPIDSISFGITNFLFKGQQYETPGHTEFINLNLSGKKAALWKVKDYDDISRFMKIMGKQHITCEIWADAVDQNDIKTMEEIIHKLCYVLSIGSGSKVQWFFYNVLREGIRIYTRHILVPNKPFNSQTIIDAEKHIQDWASFINVAYPSYIADISLFGETNGIPRIMAAIDVFTDARILTDFTQTRGIKLAVMMEMIKEMFKVAWVPDKKILKGKKSKDMENEIKDCLEPILGRYMSADDVANAIDKSYQLNSIPFETFLKKGFEKIKFTPKPEDLKLFVMNRDSLVHQGRFYSETATNDQKAICMPLGSPGDDYVFVSNFLSKVFLALLGYKGRHGELYAIESKKP